MITLEDIEKLAQLARINVSLEEKDSIRKDIEGILAYVGRVKDMASGEINNQAREEAKEESETPAVYNVMRKDVVTHESGEYTEVLLKAAPSRLGDYFKVKKILL